MKQLTERDKQYVAVASPTSLRAYTTRVLGSDRLEELKQAESAHLGQAAFFVDPDKDAATQPTCVGRVGREDKEIVVTTYFDGQRCIWARKKLAGIRSEREVVIVLDAKPSIKVTLGKPLTDWRAAHRK